MSSGLTPSNSIAGSTSRVLPRLVGTGRALDLLWSSRRIGAEEAYRIGLVGHLTAEGDLVGAARRYLEQLAAEVTVGRRAHDSSRIATAKGGLR